MHIVLFLACRWRETWAHSISIQLVACAICFSCPAIKVDITTPMYYEVVVSKTLELLPLFWRDSNFEYSNTLQLALYYCCPISLTPGHLYFFGFNQKFYPRMFRCTLVYHMDISDHVVTMWWWKMATLTKNLVRLATTWRIIPVIKVDSNPQALSHLYSPIWKGSHKTHRPTGT